MKQSLFWVVVVASSTLAMFAVGLVLWQLSHSWVGFGDLSDSHNIHLEAPQNRPLRLILVGDTGSQDAPQQAVADAMEDWCHSRGGIDAILLLGDNFYPSGVTSVKDPQWQTALWDVYDGTCLSQVSFYPLLGNHDYRSSVQAQIDYSQLEARWRLPHRMYMLRFGDLLSLAMVDSNLWDTMLNVPGTLLHWMQRQIQQSSARWKFMLSHHPVYSACSDRVEREDHIKARSLASQFCPHVDFVISGHIHQLEWSHQPLACEAPQLIVGGGGAYLRETTGCNGDETFFQNGHGFLAMEIMPESIQGWWIGADGEVLHQGQMATSDSTK